jgi:hypothetical protein
MSYPDDEHGELVTQQFLHDAIAADTEAAQPGELALQRAAGMGLVREAVDRRRESFALGTR